MIKTTTATTSSRWIKLPPTWPRKPRSQSTTKITIIVQSMVFLSVKLNFRRRIYPEVHLLAKLFQNIESKEFPIVVGSDAESLASSLTS
jgi:RNase P/RNase MRP subunit p30